MSEMNTGNERREQFKQIVFNFLNAFRGHEMSLNYNGNPINRLSEFAMILYLMKGEKLQVVEGIDEDDDNVLAFDEERGLVISGKRKDWIWLNVVHFSIVKRVKEESEVIAEILDKYSDSVRHQADSKSIITAYEMIKEANLSSDEYGELLAYAETYITENTGKVSGIFSNPQSLAVLITSLLDSKYPVVYDPYMGLATFATYLPKHVKFVGSDIVPEIVDYVNLKMALMERPYNCGCYDSQQGLSYQNEEAAIISFPPMGMRHEEDPIRNLFDSFLNGKYPEMFLVVAQNVCFSAQYKEYRKILTEKNYIDSLTQLPSRYLYGTGISTVLLHLSKRHSVENPVVFTSADKYILDNRQRIDIDVAKLSQDIKSQYDIADTQRLVSIDEIRRNNYLWVPQSYLLSEQVIPEGFQSVPLGNLVETISNSKSSSEPVLVVRISDLASNPLEKGYPKQATISTNHSNTSIVYVNEEALLVSKVRYLKPTHFVPMDGEGIYISPNIAALRVNTDVASYDYLCIELSKDYIQKQVEAFSFGSAAPFISLPNLLQIKVLVPISEKQQAEIVQHAYQDNMSEAERQLQQVYDQYRQEIHTRKHAMGQTLSAMSAMFNTLMRHIQRSGGKVDVKDIFGQPYPLSVGDALRSISNNIDTLNIRVSHLADAVSDWGAIDAIELDDFLCEYRDAHQSADYQLMYQSPKIILSSIYKNEKSQDDKTESIRKVLIPKRALIAVLDDIVSNACSHGFVDKDRLDYRIQFAFFNDGGQVVLDVSNNGAPVAPDVDIDKIFDFGYTTSLNVQDKYLRDRVHSGIGCHDIRTILRKYGADVEFISSPEEELTVTYRIIFTNVEIQESEWPNNN